MRPNPLWLERKVAKHIQRNRRLSKLCHLVGEGRNPSQSQDVPCSRPLTRSGKYKTEQICLALSGPWCLVTRCWISCPALPLHPSPSSECLSCLPAKELSTHSGSVAELIIHPVTVPGSLLPMVGPGLCSQLSRHSSFKFQKGKGFTALLRRPKLCLDNESVDGGGDYWACQFSWYWKGAAAFLSWMPFKVVLNGICFG